jgi:hypothetical protein
VHDMRLEMLSNTQKDVLGWYLLGDLWCSRQVIVCHDRRQSETQIVGPSGATPVESRVEQLQLHLKIDRCLPPFHAIDRTAAQHTFGRCSLGWAHPSRDATVW